jgi:flagellar basal-body rod modification protein FlgD
MSTTISTQASTAAANSAASALTTAGGGTSEQNPFLSLTDNFQGFLQMLMTQLQNQDPTSPMDSTQFTSELVQFSGVEQQISTNTNLTQLIQLTQGNTMVQSAQIVGKQVEVTSPQLSLQNGTAAVAFSPPAAGTVTVAVSDAAGNQIYDATVNATAGANTWTWNGQTAAGGTAPDGTYTVAVNTVAADGTTTALPFGVLGTATGMTTSGSAVQLQLGQLSVNMSELTSVGN